ncbi:MAG: NADH-quinone oxidoreductase subunit M [Gammaproteobacteria bacterium]
MILFWLILILLLGGALAWLGERRGKKMPGWISLGVLGIDLLLVAAIWMSSSPNLALTGAEDHSWIFDLNMAWIERFGIHFHLAMDGLSLLLVALTVFLGIMAVACSWTEITERVGFFHFNLLWTLAGVLGVFLALDLFLFFFFWEMMIIPMFLLIAIWGHESRIYASIKFFLFTQVTSLLMLAAILGLVYVRYQQTGTFSFDYPDLLNLQVEPGLALWLMLGFFIAFVTKLPGVPFHTWLPDAHTQAPTAGSVILAGVLLKTGAYGLLRFVVPLFPDAAQSFTPIAMILGVISIIYGAHLAFAQTDMKRLVAYTSISHMGFILVGIFAWNEWALQGAVMTMLAHGISSAALFMIAGALQERMHTRDMRRMGGLWAEVPRLSAVALFFSIAALGMPGLGNFVGEFLVLIGAYQVSVPLTALAALGLIAAPVYSLILVQKVFHAEARESHHLWDFGRREMTLMGFMIIAMVWMGVYPQSMLDLSAPVLENLDQLVRFRN